MVEFDKLELVMMVSLVDEELRILSHRIDKMQRLLELNMSLTERMLDCQARYKLLITLRGKLIDQYLQFLHFDVNL